VRVASFNLMHGMSPADGQVDTDRLVEAVAALDADVIALQEVDRHQPRSGGVDQAARIAAALGAAAGDWRFAATVVGTPGEKWWPARRDPPPGQPAYGTALISRLPVRSWSRVALPAAPVRSPIAVPGPNGRPRLMLLPDEPRVALVAVLEPPSGAGPAVTVAGTHLSFVPGWNVTQLRRLTRALERLARTPPRRPPRPGAPPILPVAPGESPPRLLLGDLNMPAPVARAASGGRPLARLATYPSTGGRIQFDHVLAWGLAGPARSARAVRAAVSDHLAVVVDLDPAPAPDTGRGARGGA
jgi:endonuclease/exonuclease/phosphatase family metal-dependent hydrolase